MRNKGRGRLIAFTLIAVCAQVAAQLADASRDRARNVSILDSMALLIAMFTLGTTTDRAEYRASGRGADSLAPTA